jgi:CheY-specific phosphatase CheX
MLIVQDYMLDMIRVVESVFGTMLGMEATLPRNVPLARDMVTAAVLFAGEWNGGVMLQCSQSDACRVCRQLLPGSEPISFDEDVRDALGELANMVGGNMKAVLPPGVALSTPIVTEGSDFTVHLAGVKNTLAVAVAGELGTFEVTLIYLIPPGVD